MVDNGERGQAACVYTLDYYIIMSSVVAKRGDAKSMQNTSGTRVRDPRQKHTHTLTPDVPPPLLPTEIPVLISTVLLRCHATKRVKKEKIFFFPLIYPVSLLNYFLHFIYCTALLSAFTIFFFKSHCNFNHVAINPLFALLCF